MPAEASRGFSVRKTLPSQTFLTARRSLRANPSTVRSQVQFRTPAGRHASNSTLAGAAMRDRSPRPASPVCPTRCLTGAALQEVTRWRMN